VDCKNKSDCPLIVLTSLPMCADVSCGNKNVISKKPIIGEPRSERRGRRLSKRIVGYFFRILHALNDECVQFHEHCSREEMDRNVLIVFIYMGNCFFFFFIYI